MAWTGGNRTMGRAAYFVVITIALALAAKAVTSISGGNFASVFVLSAMFYVAVELFLKLMLPRLAGKRDGHCK